MAVFTLGAAFILAGGTAYLLADAPGWLPLVNVAVGALLHVADGSKRRAARLPRRVRSSSSRDPGR